VYGTKAGQLIRVLGAATPLSEITAQRIDAYAVDRKTTYTCLTHRSGDPANAREACAPRVCARAVTDATVHKELQVLRWVLELAKRRGEYAADPSVASHPSKYVPRQRWLRADEAESLYARITNRFGEDRGAHFAFFLGTGARLSEARRARSTDVQTRNVNDACVTVVHLHGTKTRKANRVVIVTTVVGPWLERALEHAPGQGSDPLFRSWPNLQRDIRSACADLGIDSAGPNDFRRTFASWHLHAGIERSLVAAMLGHTSTAMLDRVYGVHTVDTRAALMTEFLWHAPAPTPAAPSVTKASADVIELDAERRRRRG
jgi:integrase